MDFSAMVAAGLAFVGWGTRLETRINKVETVLDERKEIADERHTEVIRRFDRIEAKLDGK